RGAGHHRDAVVGVGDEGAGAGRVAVDEGDGGDRRVEDGRADVVGRVEEAAEGVHLEDDGAGPGGLGVGEGAVHVARERVVYRPLDGDAEDGPVAGDGEADALVGARRAGRLLRRCNAREGGGEDEEAEREGHRAVGSSVPNLRTAGFLRFSGRGTADRRKPYGSFGRRRPFLDGRYRLTAVVCSPPAV